MITFLTEDKNTLINKQIKTANDIANKLIRGGLSAGIDPDDVVSVALTALVTAAHKYTGNNGASFETYARHRIRGEILDFLREHKIRKGRERVTDLSGDKSCYYAANSENLVSKVVGVLPAKGAVILHWRYVDDLSIEEISKKIGTSKNSAKSLVGYYCKLLRNKWSEDDLRSMLGQS